MSSRSPNGLDVHQVEFIKIIRSLSHRHAAHRVFADFCACAAIAISNAVDLGQREAREARYLDIIGAYRADEVQSFAKMLALVTESLERGFHDCLGELFMALELSNHWTGQFFTPYHVASMMARMTCLDAPRIIEQHGFVSACEPASGAGAMVIALAEAFQDQQINFQRCLHVVATDVDVTAAHMTYIQLSLYHVPAFVQHGNTLSNTVWDTFYTPAHVMGMWSRKLQQRADAHADIDPPTRQMADAHALGTATAPDAPRGIRSIDNASAQPQLTLF
jgi:hypothetical protein